MKQRWIWLGVALWCGLSLLMATYVRFSWVEAHDVAARCDAGATGVVCTLRAWVIQAFIHQRLGWTALGLAAVAYAFRSPWVAGLALFLACSGMVLYSTELGAPAALLAALVFANAGKAGKVAKAGKAATAARLSSNNP